MLYRHEGGVGWISDVHGHSKEQARLEFEIVKDKALSVVWRSEVVRGVRTFCYDWRSYDSSFWTFQD